MANSFSTTEAVLLLGTVILTQSNLPHNVLAVGKSCVEKLEMQVSCMSS